MNVRQLKLDELREYENNPRLNDGAVEAVAESIGRFGFKVPIVVDRDGVIVAGHTRFKAAAKLGLESVPCVVADDLSPEEAKAFRLADNKTGELAEWDFSSLEAELSALSASFDMEAFGFSEDLFPIDLGESETEASGAQGGSEGSNGSLSDRFVVPPFSVFDTKQGYWQDRKRLWKGIVRSEEGRGEGLLGNGLLDLARKQGSSLTGTSVFDPVLCEILVSWFCPQGGRVLDPFAGGSVRGLVSAFLGNSYTGIDIRPEQVEANMANFAEVEGMADLAGGELRKPEWIVGDGRDVDRLAEGEFDFLLTCPPYADLEVYSDDPKDLSTMEYGDFLEAYSEIIGKSFGKLRDHAFAAIVVGEVREKHSHCRNFVGDTVRAFLDAGFRYYNECILLNQISTAALRADRQFSASRKVVKTHQNVLVFVKGDEREAVSRLSRYNIDAEAFARVSD